MAIVSIDPRTGNEVRRFAPVSDAELEWKLELATRAFRDHRRRNVGERAVWLTAAAAVLTDDRAAFARLIVEEMGKPIRAAEAEIDKCALTCRHYAEHGRAYLADRPLPVELGGPVAGAPPLEGVETSLRFLPLGPVLAVMPWNFPFWQVFRFAAPALMAGNVGLLKHASNVPRCALAIEDLLRRAGVPEGVFQTLVLESRRVARVIEDRRVAAVTLTGSDVAGTSVASAAGKVLKKAVLELGGSDPFIVMPSADLDAAASVAVKARFLNSGQSCIAAKRFIVHRRVAADFERRFVEHARRLVVGDPLCRETDLGPLATANVRNDVVRQVNDTVRAGARLVMGGSPVGDRGFYYPPTVVTDVPTGTPMQNEEVFGPVAALFVAEDIDHAIALANDSPWGLGSSAWTNDHDEEQRFCTEIEAGMTFINTLVASDPRLPFGGIKRSGFGRELSDVGIHEFMNAKTLFVKRSSTHGARHRTQATE